MLVLGVVRYLEISANLVASLLLTFLMTRSSMMSQMLYVHDITLCMQHPGMHELPKEDCNNHQHSHYCVSPNNIWLLRLILLLGLCWLQTSSQYSLTVAETGAGRTQQTERSTA